MPVKAINAVGTPNPPMRVSVMRSTKLGNVCSEAGLTVPQWKRTYHQGSLQVLERA